LAKVAEELGEVEQAIRANRTDKTDAKASSAPPASSVPTALTGEPVNPPASDEITDEIGDLLFAVVNLARKLRVQPHTALDRANRKFRTRFEALERLATQRGIDMATAGLEVLDGLWRRLNGGRRETGEGRREKREK
jgi:NTP pyrophosphatase (non-canonical NTP hydrolase)